MTSKKNARRGPAQKAAKAKADKGEKATAAADTTVLQSSICHSASFMPLQFLYQVHQPRRFRDHNGANALQGRPFLAHVPQFPASVERSALMRRMVILSSSSPA